MTPKRKPPIRSGSGEAGQMAAVYLVCGAVPAGVSSGMLSNFFGASPLRSFSHLGRPGILGSVR